MELTRREVLLAAAAVVPFAACGDAQSAPSRLSVEGYIWQQDAAARKRSLADSLDEILGMARATGFRNIELNNGFFTPALRNRVLELLQSNGLSTPSVYVGGGMHQEALAEATTKQALDIARACKPLGCRAVVTNPNPKAGQEKTDAELTVQAAMLNQTGKALAAEGYQLWVHNHTPEMVNGAREWWHTLNNTDPAYVWICLDIDWVHQGDQDPLALLKAAGSRLASVHLRNSSEKMWLESLSDGDVDYRQVAAILNSARLKPLLTVELAYRPQTAITRSLEENLRLSRAYAERIFGVMA